MFRGCDGAFVAASSRLPRLQGLPDLCEVAELSGLSSRHTDANEHALVVSAGHRLWLLLCQTCWDPAQPRHRSLRWVRRPAGTLFL